MDNYFLQDKETQYQYKILTFTFGMCTYNTMRVSSVIFTYLFHVLLTMIPRFVCIIRCLALSKANLNLIYMMFHFNLLEYVLVDNHYIGPVPSEKKSLIYYKLTSTARNSYSGKSIAQNRY